MTITDFTELSDSILYGSGFSSFFDFAENEMQEAESKENYNDKYTNYSRACIGYLRSGHGDKALEAFIKATKAYYRAGEKGGHGGYRSALMFSKMKAMDEIDFLDIYLTTCSAMKECDHYDVYNGLMEMEYFEKAAEYMISITDPESEDFIHTSTRHRLAAEAYEKAEEWLKAGDLWFKNKYDHSEKAIKCYQEAGRRDKIIDVYIKIAENFIKKANETSYPDYDLKKSIEYYESALKIAKDLDLEDKIEEINIKLNRTSDKEEVTASKDNNIDSYIKCPNPDCSANLINGAKFCNECGIRIADSKRICPNQKCQYENESSAKYCIECGSSLV